MYRNSLVLLGFVLCMVACQTKNPGSAPGLATGKISTALPKGPETAQQFVQRIVATVQEGDEEVIFNCFPDKEELRVIAPLLGGPSEPEQLEPVLEQMWQSALESKGKMREYFFAGNLPDWNNVVIDSIFNEFPTQYKNFDVPEKAKIEEITAWVDKDGKKTKLLFRCVSISNGPWKMLGFPNQI